MKKKIKLILVLAFTLFLVACGSDGGSDTSSKAGGDGSYTVGVLQLMEHPSLDAAKKGFIDTLEASDLDVEIVEKNAQGEITNAKTIADKFASDGVDLIYAIATPATEAALASSTDIPIVFSAVTDPVEAGLVESLESSGNNITGTSDMVNIENQLALFKEIDPSIEVIGIIYSADETNSLQQVELAEDYAGKLGLSIETVSIQNLSDIPQASESIARDIDGLYMVSDNKVSSSTTVVTEIMKREGIPVVTAVQADTEQGGLISLGINYEELGAESGQQAIDILNGTKPSDIPVFVSEDLEKFVNRESLEALGLDEGMSVFEDATFVGE